MVDSQAFVWSESLGAYTAAANFGIMRDVEASWARRPQPTDALPRYAAAGPIPPAHKAGTFGNIAAAQPVPRAPRQRQPQTNENPYKIEYAHSGGSGRGQRGRSSIGEGTSDLPPQPPPSAMHPVAVAAPPPPPSAMHPVPVATPVPAPHQVEPVQTQAPASSSYGLQPTVAPEPYSTDNVYRTQAAATPPVTTPQPMYPAQQPPTSSSSPSLVGTSAAPQARSIQLGSGRSGAFGGGGGAMPGQTSSPFSAAPPQMTPAGLPLPGTLPPLPPQL